MRNYLKNSIFDFLFCVAMTAGITFNVFQGFYVPENEASNFLGLVLLSAGLMVLFFLCAYNKKTIAISLCAFAVAAVIGVVLLQRAASAPDFDGTQYLFGGLTAFFALLIFLLSRTKTGTAILFLLGAFIFAYIVFLQYTHFFFGFILFLCGCIGMFLYKTYRSSVLHSHTVKTSFGGFFVTSIVAGVLILGLSIGAFYALIQPLNPPTRELKLITRFMSLEIFEKLGVASQKHLYNPDQTSNQTNEENRTSQNQGETPNEQPDQVKPTQTESLENNRGMMGSGPVTEFLQAITYIYRSFLWVYLLAGIPVLVVLAILLKRFLRKRWYTAQLRRDKKEQIITFYQFFLKKFRLLGFQRAESDTPFEFAEKSMQYLGSFSVGDATIRTLTDAFVKASYGDQEVSDEEYGRFLQFYQSFFKNCKNMIGTPKYIFKFWAL